jgi:hypothetical protein
MLPHIAATELVEVHGAAYLVRTELIEKHIVPDRLDDAGEVIEEATYRTYHVRAARERPITPEEIPEFDDVEC